MGETQRMVNLNPQHDHGADYIPGRIMVKTLSTTV